MLGCPSREEAVAVEEGVVVAVGEPLPLEYGSVYGSACESGYV